MSGSSNEYPERSRISKVTFSPISSELLVVRIRKVSGEVREEDIPKMSGSFRPIAEYSADQRRVPNHSKSTMTDTKKSTSISSQTSQKQSAVPASTTESNHDSTPCLKHAAENISRKASDIPSEKINLCNNCSKSMLSYIFLVQDFLDSLAKEIRGKEENHCLQCARQEARSTLISSAKSEAFGKNESKTLEMSTDVQSSHKTELKQKDAGLDKLPIRKTSKSKSNKQESRRIEDYHKGLVNPPVQGTGGQQPQNKKQTDFIYNVSSPNIVSNVSAQNVSNVGSEKRIIIEESGFENPKPKDNVDNFGTFDRQIPSSTTEITNIPSSTQFISQQNNDAGVPQDTEYSANNKSSEQSDKHHKMEQSPMYSQTNEQFSDKQPIFRSPASRVQPNYEKFTHENKDKTPHNISSDSNMQSPTLYREDVDGIVSTLSSAEREIYDSARNGAGWEGLTESQERLGAPGGTVISSEAFVTSCRNNAEAIGCLVVGTSLLLCRTSRTLCVLVSDGVSTAFRNALSSVFQVVQYVRSLDSLGTTKLSLLEQPELGVTFEKLNIWRLIQFTKCIYLNPDTLVIQNCDELFSRDELSAVPDIGWPDCFNSGVFVYSPSVHTFWQLMEFAEKQGSYDGGDQGLLNSYFNSWSSDISKKLSFIYNLMANVSYTYTPAFRQFGRDVKIVQFHGSFKPWHVKFFIKTGQISPSSPVHPTYVQFVHIWINIFRISVLRLLSKEIQSYAASQETICAVETLRFFPLPTESESEFFLTPPSVRLRLAEKKLTKSTSFPISEARRRKSAEFFRYTDPEEDIPEVSVAQKESLQITEETKSAAEETDEQIPKTSAGEHVSEADEVFKDEKTSEVKGKVKDDNSLPGAEIGDYQGMKAWEQGRMDYQGVDRSDNVIKRLEFLMSRPK